MLTNNETKLLKELHTRKGRLAQHKFLVEGEKLIVEAFRHQMHVTQILIEADKQEWIKKLTPFAPITVIGSKLMERISTVKTPPGIMAVCNMPKWPMPETKGWYFALDKINDPGNLGTILRIANWFGFKGIIADEQTVDVYNPKVVQASMGAIFNTPIHYVNLTNWLSGWQQSQIFVAHLHGSELNKSIKFNEDGVFLIGSESHGVNNHLLNLGFNTVSIPNFGQCESLNAAVAAGILAAMVRL